MHSTMKLFLSLKKRLRRSRVKRTLSFWQGQAMHFVRVLTSIG